MVKRYNPELQKDIGLGLPCLTMKENFIGSWVTYEDYAALQQKLDAMAAENASLMKFCKNAAFDADYESELGMERGGFTDAVKDIETPATDAYLNSVRAEGAMAARNHIRKGLTAFHYGNHGVVAECADMAEMVAQRLRSGTHDTADKAG